MGYHTLREATAVNVSAIPSHMAIDSDPYIVFTRCHRKFIVGVRRAIRERLESVFREEWWNKGVAHSLQLQEEQLKHLENLVQRNPNQERHLFLDVAHFSHIIENNHEHAFSRVFRDRSRALKDFRHLTALRNEWAHVQELPIGRAKYAAELMKGILASFNCQEALEVDTMSQDLDAEPDSGSGNDSIEYLDEHDRESKNVQAVATVWGFWHELQSYLVFEQSVEPIVDSSNNEVRVSIEVRNAAPNSGDLPTVHFKSVSVNISSGGGEELGEMSPGEIRHAEFTFPEKRLIGLEFEVTGTIDSDELFGFRRAVSLPDEVIIPLRIEFVSRFEAINVRGFVKGVLDAIGNPDSNMTLAHISKVRELLKEQPELIKVKRTELNKFFRDFHLDREATLGSRVREIMQALGKFEKKLSELDEAIGDTNLSSISGAVTDLNQIQLAVLRVEDTVRTLASGKQ